MIYLYLECFLADIIRPKCDDLCINDIGENHLSHALLSRQDELDPYQFTYKRERSTEDAVATLMHLVSKHLDALKIQYSTAGHTAVLIPE